MANVNTKLVNQNGDTIVVKEESIPAASALTRGGVKQGDGVAIKQEWGHDEFKQGNAIVESLRASGAVANNKYSLIYAPNDNGDEADHAVFDDNVYTAGQSAVVQFYDENGDLPRREGYEFIGWALSTSAATPDYPYDESDPQTYTVTFTNDDITLYAVWEQKTVTITYSLGEYGTGSVPSPQTVPEGDEVQLSFFPVPTVNDGSDRIFVGWRDGIDGGDEYGDATYIYGKNDHITVYDDVTLFPVFCARVTLSYSAGSDGTGSVPIGGTYFKGQQVEVSFYPNPTCVSDPTRDFIGWAEQDGQSVVAYGIGDTVYLYYDKTLYPVFRAAQVTYTCTYYNGMYSTGNLPSPSQGMLSGSGENVTYMLNFSTYPTCTRAGTWNFIGWDPIDGKTSNPTYPASGMSSISVSPAANLTLYPVFEEQGGGGGGTGTFAVVNNSSQTVTVYHQGAKDPVDDIVVSSNSSDSFTFDDSTTYYVKVSGKNFNEIATLTGTYQSMPYNNSTLPRTGTEDIPTPSGNNSWTFFSGDGVTITVSDYSGS